MKEAARALYRDGIGPTETLRRLREKTAGLDVAYEPSMGTLEKWRAEFKRDGDIAGMTVREEEIAQVENLIYRQGLALARDWMKRMTEKQVKGDTEPKDVAVTDGYMKMIDGARKRKQLLEKGEPGTKSKAGRDLNEAAKPPSILQQLAESERRRAGTEPTEETEDTGNQTASTDTEAASPTTDGTKSQDNEEKAESLRARGRDSLAGAG